jgi:hypothetical protein
MRIIFLSSAYSGYVHMYAFEPHTWDDGDGSVVAGQQRQERQPELRAERRTLRKRGVAIFKRLTTLNGGHAQERSC